LCSGRQCLVVSRQFPAEVVNHWYLLRAARQHYRARADSLLIPSHGLLLCSPNRLGCCYSCDLGQVAIALDQPPDQGVC
jgi:hypothetical protein